MFYAGFDMLFSILFPILFLVVLGMILYTIIGNISTWNKNNHSPRLTVPATVVAKRTEVSRHHTDNTMAHTFTTYYVTFQVESGDRMELTVSGSDYGMLVEGDIGKLSFQGTRYLGFERNWTSLFNLINRNLQDGETYGRIDTKMFMGNYRLI